MPKNFLLILFAISLAFPALGLGISNFHDAAFPYGRPFEEYIHSQAEMEPCVLTPSSHFLGRYLLKTSRNFIIDSFSLKRLKLGIQKFNLVKHHLAFLGQFILCFYIFYKFGRTFHKDDMCDLPPVKL